MTSRKASLLCAAAVLAALVPVACVACDTALLVIDVQNAYVRTLDLTTIDGISLVDRLVDLIAKARAAGIRSSRRHSCAQPWPRARTRCS